MRPSRLLLLLAAGALAALAAAASWGRAETTSIRLQEPSPLLAERTLLLANLVLAAVVALQASRGLLRRRKYHAVRPALPEGEPAEAPAPRVVRCASCRVSLLLPSGRRGTSYRCPNCSAVGVSPC